MDTLTYLTLVITYQCSSRCAHCCLGAGPEFAEWMEPEDAERYIAEAMQDNQITHMTLIGGEALLDVDRAVAIGEIARRYGIPRIEINTNGSWATDEPTAKRILRRLLDAGLSVPGISVDAFHQRYVPRERVLCAMRAARELGLDLEGSSEVLEAENAPNAYDQETRSITQWLRDRGFTASPSPLGVVFQGRGVNLAHAHAGPRTIPQDRCDGVIWLATSDWRRLGGIQIDVHGWVMVEHGLTIGNAKERPLRGILASYDPDAHPIISVLMREGPIGLTRTPEAKGFRRREEGYIDKCHLCHEVRTHLRPAFPDLLAPEQCYSSIEDKPCNVN